MKNCKLCFKDLAINNRSGYCTKCYPKSPKMLEYQRQKQIEWYAKNKAKRKKYLSKPDVKKKNKLYQAKYRKEHLYKIRKQKRDWIKKNKKKDGIK